MTVSLNTYTSLFFTLNIYYLIDGKDIIYLLSFIGLLIISVLNHYTRRRIKGIDYLDRIILLNIIFQGYERLKRNHSKSTLISMIIILCFLSVVYLYVYGYINDEYCFDKENGDIYHGILHLEACIGHLLITLLTRM